MTRILGTSIGKTSSIIFLVLVVFIALALSNVSFLVSHTTAGPPFRLEGNDGTPVPKDKLSGKEGIDTNGGWGQFKGHRSSSKVY